VEADDPLALRREYAYYDPTHTLPAAGQRWWLDRARRPEGAGLTSIGTGLTPAPAAQ
jgi:lysine 2,3-aminomutase